MPQNSRRPARPAPRPAAAVRDKGAVRGEALPSGASSRKPKTAHGADRAKKRWSAQDRAARIERADGQRAYRGQREERPIREERARADRADAAPARRPERERGLERAQRPAYGRRPAFGGSSERAEDRPRAATGGRERAAREWWPERRAARPTRDERASAGRLARPLRERSREQQSGTTRPLARPPQEDAVLERLQAQAVSAQELEVSGFAELGLGSGIVRALEQAGATRPFPIQAATIPAILQGRDVLGRGRTGSGKTIAFGAPLVERLLRAGSAEIAAGTRTRRQPGRAPRALILAPTRELALQIDRTVQPIARAVGLFTTQIYGGVPQRSQVLALERGVDIVIGTPGRIEDLVEQGRLDLSHITVSVLDEADHMCELGFLEPVQRILRLTGAGQRLLFSATLDTRVAALVEEFLVEPAVYEVAGEDQASGSIDHRVFVIDHREKLEVIAQLARREGKTLVFTRTRSYAEEVADALEDAGLSVATLHGDLNQSRRTRNLERLSSGRASVLVATDVAARGIHVDDIALVVQADAPEEYKSYVHRAGRTGRAGRPGTVVTLTSRGRTRRLEGLLERAEIRAEWSEVRAGAIPAWQAPGD